MRHRDGSLADPGLLEESWGSKAAEALTSHLP